MRYGDRLDYQIQIPEELKKLYTVKLLIQPLAENSIYHGIKESDRKGTILITAGEETASDPVKSRLSKRLFAQAPACREQKAGRSFKLRPARNTKEFYFSCSNR